MKAIGIAGCVVVFLYLIWNSFDKRFKEKSSLWGRRVDLNPVVPHSNQTYLSLSKKLKLESLPCSAKELVQICPLLYFSNIFLRITSYHFKKKLKCESFFCTVVWLNLNCYHTKTRWCSLTCICSSPLFYLYPWSWETFWFSGRFQVLPMRYLRLPSIYVSLDEKQLC